jgi:hypothetical protein
MTNGRARSGILAGSAAAVLLFGAGCDGLLEPARVEATAWALESLDGAPIPAVSVANDWVTLVTRADEAADPVEERRQLEGAERGELARGCGWNASSPARRACHDEPR